MTPVVDALVQGRFAELIADDVATAQLLGLAPYGAEAEVSGEGAEEFVAQLTSDVSVHRAAGGFYGSRGATSRHSRGRSVRRRAPRGKLRIAVQ